MHSKFLNKLSFYTKYIIKIWKKKLLDVTDYLIITSNYKLLFVLFLNISFKYIYILIFCEIFKNGIPTKSGSIECNSKSWILFLKILNKMTS